MLMTTVLLSLFVNLVHRDLVKIQLTSNMLVRLVEDLWKMQGDVFQRVQS